MTLFAQFLVIHVCLPGQKAGQCGEMKIIRMRDSAFVFVLPLTDIPQRPETEQCSHSEQITHNLSDASTSLAFLQEEKTKARQAHEPPTAPTFMLPICVIQTDINWHACVSIITLKQMSTQLKNSHGNDKSSPFPAVTKSAVKTGVPAKISQFITCQHSPILSKNRYFGKIRSTFKRILCLRTFISAHLDFPSTTFVIRSKLEVIIIKMATRKGESDINCQISSSAFNARIWHFSHINQPRRGISAAGHH